MPFKNQHPLYVCWKSMRNRCTSPRNPQFKNYGARGISVCERWQTFANFVADMGDRPEGMSLDRINNDGNYEPSNCRWADNRTQHRNRRVALMVTLNGATFWADDLAKAIGVKTDTIVERAAKGRSMEEVLSPTPLRELAGLALGGRASGEVQKAKTHCPKGHEYTPENIIWTKQGWRQCRQCVYAKNRRQAAARTARLKAAVQ